MASKADRFYFENLNEAAEFSCKAAEYLETCINTFHPEKLSEMMRTIHEFEHGGDVKKHEMSSALSKAFVTPIEREDLALISQNIDEVTDSIEEVLQILYIYRIRTILPEAREFAAKLTLCCKLMKDMLAEFINFKKSSKLHTMVVELNNVEEECDALYLEAMLKLHDHCKDTLEMVSWRDIYNKLENCVDACEHVSDCIDTVIMKNT
jgi:predicted phosphate transport protein (TIGR00153 family)